MKKLLLSLLITALLLCCISCGKGDGGNDLPKETKDPLSGVVKTEAPATSGSPEDTKAPETTVDNTHGGLPDDKSKFTFYQEFKAPVGNPREIVMDYMMEMAEIQWKPVEDFTIGWEGPASFDPNMSIKFYKTKTYRGTTYGNTHCSLELFKHFLDSNNNLKMDNYSYEKIIGNNCSTTMTLAYQQIIDLPISVLKPISSRLGLLKLCGDLKIPQGKGDNWYSADVFGENGQDAVYEAYATMESGDILYKSIPGTGHDRMVRKVEIGRSATGKLMPSRSYVYCVESTNAWEDNTQTSTWFIDRKYSFSALYDTLFMPVTLDIFFEENPTYTDAYIGYTGAPTAENIKKGTIPGQISSNFPLNYAMVTVTDTDGNIVIREIKAGMTKNYTYDMRKFFVKTGDLASGNYKLTIRAGIARGGADIYSVDFTV